MPIKAYLGPEGALQALPYVGKLDATLTRAVTLRETVGGIRHAQIGPRVHTDWQASITGLRPNEVQALSLALASDNPAGLVWISPAGITQNAIPARRVQNPATGLAKAMASRTATDGTVLTPEELWEGAEAASSSVWAYIVPGRAVCASAYCDDGLLTLTFLGPDGGQVGAASTIDPGPGLSRNAVIAQPPPGATRARLLVSSTAFARPAITMTPFLKPWGPGVGTDRAIVQQASLSFQRTPYEVHGEARTTVTFDITEIG